MLVMPNVDLEILDANGNTPLFVAAQSGNSDCLYYILNTPSGCPDVNRPNKAGMTPLHIAASMGYHECVSYLLNCDGIDPNCKNNDGNTPLALTKNFSFKRKLFGDSSKMNIQACVDLLQAYGGKY